LFLLEFAFLGLLNTKMLGEEVKEQLNLRFRKRFMLCGNGLLPPEMLDAFLFVV